MTCRFTAAVTGVKFVEVTFDTIQLCDYPIFSLCQAPNNPHCLYFGEGNGELKLFDKRMGKIRGGSRWVTWRSTAHPGF
jgi:WD repeat-containing protein 76